MPTRPVRFIHSGGFRLDLPLLGAADMPDVLRDELLEAPFRAAVGVFDAALAHEADFVVLAGDLLDPEAGGPRTIAFLQQQFQRLNTRQIPVYWAWGEAEISAGWLADVTWPSNVLVFDRPIPEELHWQQPGVSPVRIVGACRSSSGEIDPADFVGEPSTSVTVALTCGEAEASSLIKTPIHYWALGGEHSLRTLYSAPGYAVQAGNPQGRSLDQAGAHGCTLVTIDDQGRTRTQAIECDVARWCFDMVEVPPQTEREDLQTQLLDRIRLRRQEAPNAALLMHFQLTGSTTLAGGQRNAAAAIEQLSYLRAAHASTLPRIWILAVEVEDLTAMAGGPEGESLLADFLRTVRHYRSKPQEKLDLSEYLPSEGLPPEMAGAATLDNVAGRQRVLDKVAVLGAQLLGGEEKWP